VDTSAIEIIVPDYLVEIHALCDGGGKTQCINANDPCFLGRERLQQ
jgi:hypothetical protein